MLTLSTVGIVETARADRAAALSPTFGFWDSWANYGDQWAAPGLLHVRGWAMTADFPTVSLGVRVTIDGWPVTSDYAIAGKPRPDVAAVYPGYGPFHGFDFNLAVGFVGTRTVCVQAQNTGIYNDIGCKVVNLNDGRWEPDNSRVLPFSWKRQRNIDPALRVGYWPLSVPTQTNLIDIAMQRWDMNLSDNRVDTFFSISSKVAFFSVSQPPGLEGASTLGYLQSVSFNNCPHYSATAGAPTNSFLWVGCFAIGATIGLTPLWFSANSGNLTTEAKIGAVVHEFGHAMGLGHIPNGSPTVMTPNDNAFSSLTSLDRTNIFWVFAPLGWIP